MDYQVIPKNRADRRGELLVRRMRAVMTDYEAALEATRAFSGKQAGSLRLSIAPPAGNLAAGRLVSVLEGAAPAGHRRLLSVLPEQPSDGTRAQGARAVGRQTAP
jgi:hypothetical protein